MQSVRWRLALAGLGLALLAAPEAQAACTGRLAANPLAEALYDPFAPATLILSGQVAVENTGGGEACLFRLRARAVAFAAEEAPATEFELRGESGELLAATGLDENAASGVASGPVAPGERAQLRYELHLPPGQMLPPGRHELAFELMLEEAETGGGREAGGFLDRAALPAAFRVEDRIGLNIAGAGVVRTIDFGELREGESRRVLIEARGNRNFILEARSRNGGVLAMDAPRQHWRIPYTLLLGGAPLAMPGRIGPFAPTGLAGQSFEAVFIVGDAADKRAGLYTDEVTIEIKPAL